MAWLGSSAHGAAMVSICDGVELLAETGVLDGRRATGHWASRPRLKGFPQVAWLTTRATWPMATSPPAPGCRRRFRSAWPCCRPSPEPRSPRPPPSAGRRRLEPAPRQPAVQGARRGQAGAHGQHGAQAPEVVALRVHEGDDEVALALHAEAWSRTMRNDVRVVSDAGGPVTLRGGLRVQRGRRRRSRPNRAHAGAGRPRGRGAARRPRRDRPPLQPGHRPPRGARHGVSVGRPDGRIPPSP